jgi:hypothetical protein
MTAKKQEKESLRVLKKLIATQLVIFTAFMVSRRVHYHGDKTPDPCLVADVSNAPRISRSTLKLCSHLHLSGFFPFPTKAFYAFLPAPI